MLDTYGQRIDQAYLVITDPFFERRLKAFDPALKLSFDQMSKRWVILEKAPDGSGFNCIIKAEYPDKTERPLGEWVFEKLHKYRQIYELKVKMGASQWLDDLKRQALENRQKEEEKISLEHQALIRDDLISWRKASRELQNMPTSDITAGYRKVL